MKGEEEAGAPKDRRTLKDGVGSALNALRIRNDGDAENMYRAHQIRENK